MRPKLIHPISASLDENAQDVLIPTSISSPHTCNTDHKLLTENYPWPRLHARLFSFLQRIFERQNGAIPSHPALRTPARVLSSIARMATGVDIHPEATIGRRVFIDHATGVVIGQTAEVGEDVVIFHGVTLGGVAMNPGKRHPTIGNHVMIGAGAKVLGPITVGDGAKVGANAVVTKDVPEDAVAIGVPAKLRQKPEERMVEDDRDLIIDPNCWEDDPTWYI